MKNSYVGIIGFGSQGKRIFSILKKLKFKNLVIFKINKFYKNKKLYTNNFSKIKKCDIVFVCSPNNTHFKYVKSLEKNIYIFCEKPPVNNINELNKLKKMNLNRVYFNYNYRFSEINSSLQSIKKYNFGKLLYGNIVMAHGLASKKNYNISWRSKDKGGVYDILGIHIIDLILNNYKISLITKKLSKFSSNYSVDNAYFTIKLENFGQIDCYVSYSTPYKQKFEFIFENGLLEIDNKSICFKGPRNTFDNKGFFITPQILYKKKFNQQNDYHSSLEKSVNYFLKCFKNKQSFKKKDTKISLKSNKLML
jgi:predicted dehydrogenase